MILIAFGVGLLVARFFPAQFLLAVLAALLVMFGVALCRNFWLGGLSMKVVSFAVLNS